MPRVRIRARPARAMWWLLVLCALGLLWSAPPSLAASEAESSCTEIAIYVRAGCPHCERALEFLEDLARRHPETSITRHDVSVSREARERLIALSRERGLERVAVPTIVVCDQVLVGFDDPSTTGAAILGFLGYAGEGDSEPAGDGLTLPFLGTVAADDLGLPLFTVAVGLVDGFNPCAMWVLLFLLSLLVHVRSRARILLVAGTFVLVSGVVYFAFMAAWLNAYLVIGLSRTLQVAVGCLALLIGAVHLKDFFAMGHGPSLSIPERTKPGIYARVRRIVQAEDLIPAMLGVTVLAAVVNLVELLCTAGLPALYTQILVARDLTKGAYYGYLLLYNLAYIFDDALVVGIAVYTLSRTKLQERQGRWLKLVSAVVIIGLGLALLIAPERLAPGL